MNRFEVVDSTGDEGYISLGSFPSLAEAIREIETETVNGCLLYTSDAADE